MIFVSLEKEKLAKRETRRGRKITRILFVFRGRLRRKIRFALSSFEARRRERIGREQRSDVIPGRRGTQGGDARCSGTTAKKRETRSSHRGPRVNEMPRCETRRPTFAAAFEEVNRGPRSD